MLVFISAFLACCKALQLTTHQGQECNTEYSSVHHHLVWCLIFYLLINIRSHWQPEPESHLHTNLAQLHCATAHENLNVRSVTFSAPQLSRPTMAITNLGDGVHHPNNMLCVIWVWNCVSVVSYCVPHIYSHIDV